MNHTDAVFMPLRREDAVGTPPGGQAEVRAKDRPKPTIPTKEEVENHDPHAHGLRELVQLLCRHASSRATATPGQVRGRQCESDDGLDVLPMLVPNMLRHDPRDLTVAIHGDDFVRGGVGYQLDYLDEHLGEGYRGQAYRKN